MSGGGVTDTMFADTWHGCFEVGLSMQLPTASASIFVERRRSVGPQVGKLMVSYALTVDNCASSDIAVLQNAAFADRLSSCLVYSEIVYPVRLAFATSDFLPLDQREIDGTVVRPSPGMSSVSFLFQFPAHSSFVKFHCAFLAAYSPWIFFGLLGLRLS